MKRKDRMAIEGLNSIFYISKRSLGLIILSLICLIGAYIALRFWEEKANAEYLAALVVAVKTEGEFVLPNKGILLSAVESGIFTLITITITYLIFNLVIEKRSQNEIYAEAFSDMCNNQNMKLRFERLGEVSYQLETELKKRRIPKDMMEFSIGKIVIPEKEFYYNDCNIDITCSIKNGYFEKKITKSTTILSYDANYTFSGTDESKRYSLARYCGSICDRKPIDIEHIYINNQEAPYYSVVDKCVSESLSNKQGYKKEYTVYYNHDLPIAKNRQAKIVVDYTTFAPLDDPVYVFRLPCACKKLHLTYRLKDMPNYKLYGHAFGFFDNATSSHNTDTENVLQFDFENWVFQRDGISISMIPVLDHEKS